MSETEAIVGETTAEVESADTNQVEASQDQPEKPSEEPEQDTQGEADDDEDSNDKPQEEKKDDFVPFSKKAKNAIRNRDRTIAKLQKELQEIKTAQAQPQEKGSSSPRQKDFDSYSDYLEAKIFHKIMSEQGLQQKAKEPAQETNVEVQQYIAKKNAEIAEKSASYAKEIPDYQEVMAENVEYLDYLPEHVQQVLYEANDAALAVYNLAKTGDLYALAEMNPYQAAMLIGQAEMQKPVKPPPAAPKHIPVKGVKGTGRSVKSLKDMTPDELMKKFKL